VLEHRHPCRTLNAGVSQVDPAGEVIVIDTGSFAGANITKAVRISVPAGVTAFSASPITVNAGASDVVVIRLRHRLCRQQLGVRVRDPQRVQRSQLRRGRQPDGHPGFDNQTGTLESLGNNLVRGNATNTVGTITIVAGQQVVPPSGGAQANQDASGLSRRTIVSLRSLPVETMPIPTPTASDRRST
jgi:hypothetical protein